MSTGLDVMIDQARELKKEQIEKKAAKIKDDAMGMFEEGCQHAKAYIKKEPIKAVLIATTVGLAIGLFAFKK